LLCCRRCFYVLLPYTTLFRSAPIGHATRLMVVVGLAGYSEYHKCHSTCLFGGHPLAYRIQTGETRTVPSDAKERVGSIHTFHDKDRKSTRLNSSHVKISYAVY